MSAAEDTTLEITRMFDAPAARVYNAWLNREEWRAQQARSVSRKTIYQAIRCLGGYAAEAPFIY